MINEFTEISIRGRLAYGALCLEETIRKLSISNELLHTLILPRIWDFTSLKDLSGWDERINEITPCCILEFEPVQEEFDCKTISFETYQRVFDFYSSLPTDITDLIDYVIEIGTANLYGGTGEDSSYTLSPLSQVLDSCMKLGIELPLVEPFRKSKFSEFHGWGNEHLREYFVG